MRVSARATGRLQSRKGHRGRVIAIGAFSLLLVMIAAAVVLVVQHMARPAPTASRPVTAARPNAVKSMLLPRNSILPASGVLLGAWVKPTTGFTDQGQEAGITTFERAIGRKLGVISLYTTWSAPMPVVIASWVLRGGAVPMITWAGGNWRQILAGSDDLQIRQAAGMLKSLHGPVLLRYAPEMNLPEYSKIVGGPREFIAAWRHVHAVFDAAGAANVQWVWTPTSSGFPHGAAQRFYPGNAYVDWIGADGFNWAPELPGRWRSFSTIFVSFYQWAARQGKPLLIGEFGSDEGQPGAKAGWLRQAGMQLQKLFPLIRVIVYFNSIRGAFAHEWDWKVTSSPSALAAFRAVAREPYFSAHPIL